MIRLYLKYKIYKSYIMYKFLLSLYHRCLRNREVEDLVNELVELKQKNKILKCKIKEIDAFVKLINMTNITKCID